MVRRIVIRKAELLAGEPVIDKRGQVVKRYVGAPDFDALDQLIEQLLAEA